MECLWGFTSSVSRDLVCAALNQLRYPCCFNNFVKKLEQEERDLNVTRDSVQKFVAHAHRQTRKTSEVVDKWLQDATCDVDNVKELLKEARTQKFCCFGHCPNWIWRYRVGKKLANKSVDLEKFIKDGRKHVPFDRIATLPSGTLDILSEKCMNFESRQSAYEKIMEAVKNNDVAMIGLYGMGGCGKTTLAMDVRRLVYAEHLFDKVLFVTVSSTVEVRRIQEKIASSLQYTFPETEEMERAQRLCLRLTEEKKILVILDDVWEHLDFGRIGIPSFEHHKGCKILITTRSEEVCTSMDCQRMVYLPILTDEEAWNLFQNKAHVSEGTSDTLKHMGRLISNECKGLPVAIAAVASTLKGKAETIWSVALNKLRSSKPINIERGLTNPYKCLQLSYDNLDTEEAKSLFLLCSVFPEDFEIPLKLLTRCAIGLGIVREAHSYKEARSEVIAAKIKLVSSCLLLVEEDQCVQMHDLVRDVAHLIAKNENSIIKCESEKNATLEQNLVRYLWCEKFPNDLDCSNLEFLCLRGKLEEWDGIFKRMGMLKVLILINQEDEKIKLSKITFKKLTNLRYLHIDNCELSDFSFVSYMKKLQSLSLYRCSLPSFPELQIDVATTQLTTLKLLELNKCDIKGKKFEMMKRTPLLEELYIINLERHRKPNCEDTIEFFNTFSVPQTLQRYAIILGKYNFLDYNHEEFSSYHRALSLTYFHISNEVIKSLAKKTKDLSVANIEGGAKNIIPDIFQIEEGVLDELIKFEIRDSKEIECLIDTSNHLSEMVTPFSKLHMLRMDKMENLRALWHCFLPASGPFENLEKLYLSDCPRLTSLFTYVIARSLVQLKILNISRCDGLKHILADDDKMEKSQSEYTSGHPVQIFPNLQEVEVNECRELKHIFSTSIVRDLAQLEVLKIENCDMLDQIIGDIIPSADQDKKELDEIIEEGKHPHLYSTSIPSTTVVNHSPELKVIFPTSVLRSRSELKSLAITECRDLKQIMEEDEDDKKLSNSFTFPKLTTLEIVSCKKLEIIFLRSLIRCLPELNILTIRRCKNLRQIIEEDMEDKTLSNLFSPQPCFPKLGALCVEQCHKLKTLFSGSESIDLSNLHILIINGAFKLEELVGCVQGKGDDKIGKSKFVIPRLKLLMFKNLPSFCQETELPNLENCIVYNCPKLSLTSTTTQRKLSENFPYEAFEGIELPLVDLLNLQYLIETTFFEDYMSMDSSEFPSSQEIGDVGNESIEDGSVAEGAETESLSTCVSTHITDILEQAFEEFGDVGNESIEEGSVTEGAETKSLSIGVSTHVTDILEQAFEVVEQDDKMDEDKARIVPSQGIQVEGLNLLDKQQGIDIVSNNNIDISPASADIRTRLGPYKNFVDLDDAQIALLVEAITTYPHLWNACEKFSKRFQARKLKVLADMLLFLQKESVNSVTSQREQEFHKLCEEAVEVGFQSSWVDEMRQRVMVRDPKLREDIAHRQMDENPKRSSGVDMELDSQVVEQGHRPNGNCKRTSVCLKTQNVNSSFKEGSNLVGKEGEISVVSTDCIVALRNEEPEKEFVAEVSTLEIPRITTLVTNSQLVETLTPSYLNISLHETPSNALMDKQRISEPCLMNHQKPLGEIVSSPKISQSIGREAVEETIAKNINMVASSIHYDSATSQLDQLVTSQSISHPHSEISCSQTKTHTAEASEGHPKIIQDFGTNGIISLFAPISMGIKGEDNRVEKTLVEIEKYIKMSLKDIVSSETYSLRLLSSLNFFSNLPFKDITLSDGLRDIIDIIHQEFPSILCSFKQGFATIDKLAMVEARRNEVAINLVSKISEVENFYNEAQLKEVVLKEQIIRLKEEIKVCEAALSSLEEEKNKCIAETIGYKLELENVRKDKSQMVEDQRKVRQELFEVAYKWSVLCSQYEHNRMAARNPS